MRNGRPTKKDFEALRKEMEEARISAVTAWAGGQPLMWAVQNAEMDALRRWNEQRGLVGPHKESAYADA